MCKNRQGAVNNNNNGPVDRSRVDFLYYDGNPPFYDYYYDNEISDIKVTKLFFIVIKG